MPNLIDFYKGIFLHVISVVLELHYLNIYSQNDKCICNITLIVTFIIITLISHLLIDLLFGERVLFQLSQNESHTIWSIIELRSRHNFKRSYRIYKKYNQNDKCLSKVMLLHLENLQLQIYWQTYAIYDFQKDIYLRASNSTSELFNIVKQFEETWNFPNKIEAIVEKHTRIKWPKNSRGLYYSYKGIHNFALLAVCNANYCLTLFDLDQHRCSDNNGVLVKSKLEKLLHENKLHVLKRPHLSGGKSEPTPSYLHKNDIFLLQMWLLHPFSWSKLRNYVADLHIWSSIKRA